MKLVGRELGVRYVLEGSVAETGAAYIDRAIVLNPNLAAAWSVSGWLRIYHLSWEAGERD